MSIERDVPARRWRHQPSGYEFDVLEELIAFLKVDLPHEEHHERLGGPAGCASDRHRGYQVRMCLVCGDAFLVAHEVEEFTCGYADCMEKVTEVNL